MNKYIENAIVDLIDASQPSDLLNIFDRLNMNGQDFCIESSLDEYRRSSFSEEIVLLINESDSDLLSYFLSQNIFFLDNEILEEMKKMNGKNYNFEVDYSVMIDSNYANYISMFLTNPERLNRKVRKNLDVLIRNDFRFDYIIYIIESFYNVFNKEGINSKTLNDNKANFYYNLLNLELFKNINTQKYIEEGIIAFNIDRQEAYILTDQLYNNILNSHDSKEGMKSYFDIHKMMTLYIIGILKVRFSSNKAPHNKMNYIFEFMNEVAGLYFEREIKFTYDYFENPSKFQMFDVIYRKIDKTHLFETIQNIAWDFSIPRIVERAIVEISITRYYIPFILTHDNNMKTVFNSYKAKGVIFNKDKSFLTTYSNINMLEYLQGKKCKIDYENLFSDEARERRQSVFQKNKQNEFKVIKKEFDMLAELLNCTG